MSKIFDALNELVPNAFDPRNGAVTDRLTRGTAASVTKELIELEKMLVHRIGGMRTTVMEEERLVAIESQRTAQTIEGLNGEIRALDGRLKETRDILERKDFANQVLQRDLTARINDLQSEVRKQEEVLESRASEVKVLKSEVNRLRDGIRAMVSVFSQQGRALAGNPVENLSADEIAEPLNIDAENPESSQFAAPSMTSVVSDASSTIVPSIFER